MQITHKVELDTLKIFFEGILHLSVYLKDMVAFQSYIESDSLIVIKIHLKIVLLNILEYA